MKQETGRRIARWGYMAVAAGYLWWNLARMTEFSWTFTVMPVSYTHLTLPTSDLV